LDAIEKAIRNAFEKGNAEDRSFREKVYRSAFAALDRALQANPGVTVESAINRRKAMQAKIAEIESEFLPAVAVAPVQADGPGTGAAPAVESPAGRATGTAAPSTDAPGAVSTAPRIEPAAERTGAGVAPRSASSVPSPGLPPAAPDIRLEPPLAGSPAAAPSAADVAPDRDERRARRRRFPAGLVLGVLLLAAAGYGLWWALDTGLLRLPAGTGMGSPPVLGDDAAAPPVDPSEPLKPGAADQDRDWITIFVPSDPTLVSAPADAGAEVMKDDTGSFLRIRSGASGSAVSFDVGQGILEQLAGKHAVFDVVARAEDGKDTQMSIDCNFGELGDCGRKRYAVVHEKNEYLFDVQFPDKHPGAAGTIAVDSDFDKQGRSVDIYEIRVSVAE
jgi:hypothetical protein